MFALRRRLLSCSTSSNQRQALWRSFSGTSGSEDLVLLDVDKDSGIATLTMNRPPVNSLSMEMLQAISKGVKDAESNREIQSLILASSSKKVFCAGLDIQELHKPDTTRLVNFWNSFQQLYLDLYGSRLATMAAMEGHAPAAGCMLALSCDYRIMAAPDESQTASIGLNETKLGIVAPSWLGQQFLDTVGVRQAELGLSMGLLYSPDQALKIGLVDELVPQSEVLDKARQEAKKWMKIPPMARYMSKMFVRKEKLERLVEGRQQDTDFFCKVVLNDKTQFALDAYMQSLKKK